MKIKAVLTFIFLNYLSITNLIAGPPYDTDDPEPVDYKHWEVYCASHISDISNLLMGTLPHFEVNYGIFDNTQLHIIAPMAYNKQPGENINYGYGDTELGIKYRLSKENTSFPEIGVFPLVEQPSGNASKGLGNGEYQFYLPLWIQKSFGKLTTYGGGGYWIIPNAHNYAFLGWLAQYQFLKPASLGCEFYYIGANQNNNVTELRFNIGSTIDLTEKHHLLFSAGRSLKGVTIFQAYIGYQYTI
jgi:hypothetical protein